MFADAFNLNGSGAFRRTNGILNVVDWITELFVIVQLQKNHFLYEQQRQNDITLAVWVLQQNGYMKR